MKYIKLFEKFINENNNNNYCQIINEGIKKYIVSMINNGKEKYLNGKKLMDEFNNLFENIFNENKLKFKYMIDFQNYDFGSKDMFCKIYIKKNNIIKEDLVIFTFRIVDNEYFCIYKFKTIDAINKTMNNSHTSFDSKDPEIIELKYPYEIDKPINNDFQDFYKNLDMPKIIENNDIIIYKENLETFFNIALNKNMINIPDDNNSTTGSSTSKRSFYFKIGERYKNKSTTSSWLKGVIFEIIELYPQSTLCKDINTGKTFTLQGTDNDGFELVP